MNVLRGTVAVQQRDVCLDEGNCAMCPALMGGGMVFGAIVAEPL